MNNQSKSDRKKYSAKYQEQQAYYWSNLKADLEALRQKYGATYSELADGLEISRQRLYEFLNNPADGLPIAWANLMGLWDCITQPDEKIASKLKEEHRKNREQLKRSGAKQLLERSGFLPWNEEQKGYRISSSDSENPQVYRAVSRLNSSWIQDDIVRTYLANQILDLIIEGGKLDHRAHTETITQRHQIEFWPESELNASQESEAVEKYRQEIRKLFDSGKQEFVTAELFELYHSIYEHEVLNIHIPNHIDIIDCQFRIVSNSIHTATEAIKWKFARAEQTLIDLLRGNAGKDRSSNVDFQADGRNVDSLLASNPVIEVAIGCNFSYNHNSYPSVIWRYSSTAPHIRNMFIAVKNGLGYPFQLAGIFTRSTGRLERSLIRSEVILCDPEQKDKVYQGWWVDANTIHGVLRATVDAVKRWLADQNLGDISRYYESFQKLAEIDEKLFVSRASFYSRIPGLNYSIAEDCVREIQEITHQFSNVSRSKYFQQHINLLTRKSRTAQLTQIHIALLEGNIQEAERFFNVTHETAFLDGSKDDTTSQDNSILILNASSCLMFYYLLTGNPTFLDDKEWRTHKVYCPDNNLERLGTYIRAHGCIDADAYLYASQFLGTIAYLEFYTAQKADDVPFLEKAIEHLLAAAHYACRIGHMKRALHWLAYISRIHCRLGNLKEAVYYSTLAQRETAFSNSLNQLGDVEPLMTYSEFTNKVNMHLRIEDYEGQLETSGNSQDWSMANIYLSIGEISLFQEEYEKAVKFFVRALEISISAGFSRLAADSIYDLYRTALQTDPDQIRSELLKLPQFNRNEFTQKLGEFIAKLEQTKTQHIPIKLQEFSIKIWNDWANVKRDTKAISHPFGRAIQEGLFLEKL